MRSSNEPTHTRHRVSARHERRAAAHGSSSLLPFGGAASDRVDVIDVGAVVHPRLLGSVANHASRISVENGFAGRPQATGRGRPRRSTSVRRRPSGRPVHRAARMPGDLFAAIDAPVPVQQRDDKPGRHGPPQRPERRPHYAQAQSSRSSSVSAPCSTGSCPRRRNSSTTASATPVRLVGRDRDPHVQQARHSASSSTRPPREPAGRYLRPSRREVAAGSRMR